MSNQNVWKNNWNNTKNHAHHSPDPNHTSNSSYRSMRNDNRYTPYSDNNNKPNIKSNSYQDILQRNTLKSHNNSSTPPENNGHGHVYDSYYNDNDNDNMEMTYEYNKRFPQCNDNISDKNSSNKWKSQRVEKIKQQQPIYANESSHSASHSHSGTPLTYTNSRFSKFTAQEQTEQIQPMVPPNEHSHEEAQIDQHEHENDYSSDACDWYYKDPSGQLQGPFDKFQMSQWFNDGYFPQDLPIRCNDTSPFIQLKDWFKQGMNAFLDAIPQKWPQTNEDVIINPISYSSHSHSHNNIYPIHNTPPSSDNEQEIEPQQPPGTNQQFDDGTNDNNNAPRMASIHPRPETHVPTAEPGDDNAINYYLDGGGNGNGKGNDNEYDYNEEDESDTPPPINPINIRSDRNNNNSLTWNNNDSTLAATPPNNIMNKNDMIMEDEYNYTPSMEEIHMGNDMYRSISDQREYNNNNNMKKGYDPIFGQDLFANGRRIYNTNESENKFNMNTQTHTMEQGVMNRKYNQTSNSNRKPPIRHKWPHHFVNDIVNENNNVSQSQEQVQSQNNTTTPPPIVPTKPPHHSGNNRYKEVNNNNSKTKRKRRKKKNNNLNNNSNVWGGQSIVKSMNHLSFNDLQAEDKNKMAEIKRKQRENMFKKKTQPQPQQQQVIEKGVSNQNSNQNISNKNVWKTSVTQKIVTQNMTAKSNNNTNKILQPQIPMKMSKNNKRKNNNNKKGVQKNNKNKNRNKNKNKNSNKNSGNNNNNNNNIEQLNKVSPELQNWLRTEIKKLNPDVDILSVAHLLLTLDDNMAKTTAYHTFGNNSDVNTFINSFLVHRNHDMIQKKNKINNGMQKKKKNKKSRR